MGLMKEYLIDRVHETQEVVEAIEDCLYETDSYEDAYNAIVELINDYYEEGE